LESNAISCGTINSSRVEGEQVAMLIKQNVTVRPRDKIDKGMSHKGLKTGKNEKQ